MKDYENWVQEIAAYRLPRFEELPKIPLYLDQVLEYVNDILSGLFKGEEDLVTRSMINNYVKNKIMPAPIKKRYTDEHVAHIIVISIFKSVLSLPNIAKGIEIILEDLEPKAGYNVFADFIENSIQETLDPILKTEKHIPLKIASKAFAGKVLIDHYFKSIKKEEI